jgi:hypothetical protein
MTRDGVNALAIDGSLFLDGADATFALTDTDGMTNPLLYSQATGESDHRVEIWGDGFYVGDGTAGPSNSFTASGDNLLINSGSGNMTLQANGGILIGGLPAQEIGFYGATPVVQAANIANPTGGGTIDAEARTAINSILAALEGIGITAI